VVGGDDQRPRIAQAVEFLQVEAAGAEDFEKAQVEAEAPGDEAPPDRLRPALWQQGLEEQGEGQPAEADQRQRTEPDDHGDGFVGNPPRIAGTTALSHRP